MATQVAERPTGVVAEAFTGEAARQGAYDFLESDLVETTAIEGASGGSCAVRSAAHDFVFVPIDSTTISLNDPRELKEIGAVGNVGRGLKAITAIAVAPNGVPVGLAAQHFWARPQRPAGTRKEHRAADRKRPPHEREVQHWVSVIKRVGERFKETNAKAWFVLDREGDAHAIIDALLSTEQLFTVRATHDRTVDERRLERGPGHRTFRPVKQRKLRVAMQRRPIMGRYEFDVVAGPNRIARRAKLMVRTHRLSLRIRMTKGVDLIPVNVVWVHEEGSTPCGEQPLDWMLFTNHAVDSRDAVQLVIHGYTQRWRIEEVHRTWKSGGCGVEQSQLRGSAALMKWATLLASVAIRIERLKYLARGSPNLPASVELTEYEIKAVVLLKRREKKRTEEIEGAPTIAVATRWIAELGGYTGKSSGGPPGAITIGRGLNRIRAAAAALEQLECERQRDQG